MKMKTFTPWLLGTLLSAGALAQTTAPAPTGSTPQDKQTAGKPGYGMGPGMGPGMWGGCDPGMMYGMHPGMYGMHPGMYGMGPGMMGYGMGMMGPGMGMGMGPGMMGYGGGGMADLTPEQRSQISKIQDETRKQNWTLMGQLMDEQARLRDQYNAAKPDNNAIVASQKRIGDLQRQIYENASKAHERMDAVLTKEQKERFRKYWRN